MLSAPARFNDREADRILASVDLHRNIVGHIVDDVNPDSPDRLLDLCLHLTVEESGVLDRDIELGADELCRTLSRRDLLVPDVIYEGDLLQDLFLSQPVPVGEILGKLVVTLYVKTSEVLHNLTGKVFGTGTGYNTQLMRLHYAHKVLPG